MSARTLFRHYLVTASRNLVKHKLYSFINIVGLSVGLACAIFIVLFLRDELSYDRWIPQSSNLYRLELTFHLAGRHPWPLATAPFPVLLAMQEEIPEVKATTHLLPEPMTVTVGNRQFFETVAVVDPSFFQVIRLPLVEGDPASVLAQPESIVLSQSVARKYFGDLDPLGKTRDCDRKWNPVRSERCCLPHCRSSAHRHGRTAGFTRQHPTLPLISSCQTRHKLTGCRKALGSGSGRVPTGSTTMLRSHRAPIPKRFLPSSNRYSIETLIPKKSYQRIAAVELSNFT